ncbi:hypothetical protein ACFL6I_14925 [candidate division KSB1 bacterium]
MTCTIFENWLKKKSVSRIRGALPADMEKHLQECDTCRSAAREAEQLHIALRPACIPEQDDEFWENYLTTVLSRTRQDEKIDSVQVAVKWSKRLFVSATSIALVLVAVMQYRSFFGPDSGEEIVYSSTLDFMLEEHELTMSQYAFDMTSIYVVDEIVPVDWEEPQVIKN